MEYGILDKIKIGIQHMNARQQEISDVQCVWWIQRRLKTNTSYSFK